MNKPIKHPFQDILIVVILFSLVVSSAYNVKPNDYPTEPQILSVDNIETRANDTQIYTELALDFVELYYPNKTFSVFNTSEKIPYPESGYSYQQIEIDIYPGEVSPFDTVIVTIRHDTLNTELGAAQYVTDYEEWCGALPIYYKKMESQYRNIIVNNIGYLPNITDPASSLFSASFVFFYSESNETELTSYLRDNKLNYSLMENNDQTIRYVLSNMTLKECLLAANQSFIQSTGINIMGQWELCVIDTWHYDEQEELFNPILLVSIMIIAIVSAIIVYRVHAISRMKK